MLGGYMLLFYESVLRIINCVFQDGCLCICVVLVVKHLYIIFLIHKERFGLVYKSTMKLGFGELRADAWTVLL